MKRNQLGVASDVLNEAPLAQRRRPSAALERVWLLAASGDKEEGKRALRATSLSLPVPLDSITPAKAGKDEESPPQPFEGNLRFDLLEYPQGPLFRETDLELLSLYPRSKASFRWLVF